jgi:hypothetical protein
MPGSFLHNPHHRLFTRQGFFQLPAALEASLDRRLRAEDKYLLWPDEGRLISD